MDLIAEKRELFEKRFFFVIAIYIILDLTRLHSLLSLGFMRPGLIVLILLSLFLLASQKLSESINSQVRLILVFVLLLFAHVPFAINNYRAYTTALGMFAMLPFILSVTGS